MAFLSGSKVPSPPPPVSPEGAHHARVATAYQAASLVLVALGVMWICWLGTGGPVGLLTLNAVYVVAGAYVWFRSRSGEFYGAAVFIHVLTFVAIIQVCLIYDVPNDAAPRVTQIYFLVLAFLCYVTFHHVNAPVTTLAVLVYLGCFVFFSSTNYALSSAAPLPDSMRVPGAVIHSIVGTLLICACVRIMQSDYATRSSFGRQLALALADNQFELHYQPQVDRDGAVCGAEALLRWRQPKRGLVPPAEFIPAAEKLGVMKPIGKWVIETACAQLSAWTATPATATLRLAVNVSAQQFHDPDFVETVRAALAQHGVDPGRLELELTESIVVGDMDETVAKMHELVGFGVSLSLDDFGTGYSSLKYLKRMPIRQVKIDQSFVRDMLEDERDAAIVRSILQIGRELGLSVIAEGVETEDQRAFLLELGCTEFQGYLFGAPVPAGEFGVDAQQALSPKTAHAV